MQKKAARLCCAILLMAVAIAASMGLMSAVFAAQSLRTPDTQAAEAPTEAPLMLVRVLFCTDGEISEITIQDEGGQELQRLIPGRDGSAFERRAVVYPDGAGNARCSLFGVPLGTTYALLENGVQRATVTLTADEPEQLVRLAP